MDDKRSQDSELWQMIDAARPASDDLTLPEFARAAALNRENPQVRAVSQRSQRLDLAIGDALQDLPVPAGAVERLLSALTNSATSTHEPSAIPTSKAGETAHSNDIPAPTAKTPLLAPERSVPASNPSSDLHSELTGVGSKATGVGDAQDAAAEHDAHNEARRRRRLGSSWGAMSVAVVVVLLAVIILRPRGGELGPNGVLNDDWLFACLLYTSPSPRD